MKTLDECKDYYKKVYTAWYASRMKSFKFDDAMELQRINDLYYHLEFIYGPEEFAKAEREWRTEAVAEYWEKTYGKEG